MLKKLIHIIFLPCSEAAMLMEKRNAENISPKENRKLSLHLAICKWCRAYREKLEMLDRMLKTKLSNKDQVEINEIDIQDVKEKVLKNLDIS